ncbi:hypothetical protein Aca07nite_10930 [Actinoplanes capillaceus]|uniref:Hint domain-containing protein n=1 Tax=Actinoplanes campanulatus TaxID=113559 RepID=A0ABQ3WFR9_9ACTN|nr:RHS repeat-associated core domain-containing protein [Actinoplanes capillaceus]GID43818.1 hypothetical protein Aca07nite_10930 [Actinoplanes capillaceus]
MRSVDTDGLFGPGRRLISGALAALLISGLLVGSAEPVQAEPRHLASQTEKLDNLGKNLRTKAWAATPPARKPAPKAVWPAPGKVRVDLPAAGAATRAAAAPVRAGTLPVSVNRAQRRDGAPLAKLDVEVLDRAKIPAKWRDGLVVRLTAPEGASSANISVDYSSFKYAYGADWASRLKLWKLPECAVTASGGDCSTSAVPSTNDVKTGRVTADIPVGDTGTAMTARSTLVALAAAPSGEAGDFTATSLAASATWSAGGNSGGFNWNYPIRVPPASSSLIPSLSLAYASGNVDGRSEVTNNQPSWLGEGFDYAPGFIERSFVNCSQDMDEDVDGANNDKVTGDLCWRNDNATMSLSGTGGELIYESGKGWHSRNEAGAKIERVPGTKDGYGDGESWKVTTADGTQYFFGLESLPGQTAKTNSAWTVPVAGNHAGEPCHADTFKASFCTQTWRWNLDYVVDVRGNTMSYWYGKETNKYARNVDEDDVVSYVRGGYLDRIDYGTWDRGGADRSITATGQVDFVPGDRCDTSSCGTHNGTNWPDTPWDQECTGSTCDEKWNPTFWSTKRLAKVITRVWDTTKATPGWQDVDSWTFDHSFPDSGDGSIHEGMWLESIVRTGHVGGTVQLPPVTFFPTSLPNRVFTANTATSNWQRIDYIVTETGAKIDLEWELPQCSASNLPASPETNIMRCYPVKMVDPDDPAGERLINQWWHQHRVKSVSESDLPSDVKGHPAPPKFTFYEYVGGPAWHYADDNGLSDPKSKTWSQFRGYAEVRTRIGETPGRQMLTVTKYLRGMHGDRLAPSGGTRSVPSPASLGSETVLDEDQFAGMVREETVYNGDETKPVGKKVNVPWMSAPTATRTINKDTVTARFVNTKVKYDSVAIGVDGRGGWRTTRQQFKFDDTYGLPEWAQSDGDISKTGDEQCATSTYNHNTTKNLHLEKQVTATALPCSVAPTSQDHVLSDVRNYYDLATSVDTAPTYGAVTKTEKLKNWTPAGKTEWQTERERTFDQFGRVVTDTDARKTVINTSYTPSSGGPATKVTTTRPSPYNWTTSTEISPYWGSITKSVDQNGGATTAQYDALGRTWRVWQLGWDYTGHEQSPSAEFTYHYAANRDAYPYTVSKVLHAGGGYQTTYEIQDSLLRPRQTQTAGVGEGRIVTDTIHNALGQADTAYAAHAEPGDPSGTVLWKPEWSVPAITRTEYDNAGRATAQIQLAGDNVDNLVEKWRTTYAYEGNLVRTTPPAGATPTTAVTDVFGRTIELRQHITESGVNGSYQSTWYSYNHRDELTKVVDHDKNEWKYTYDVKGRQIESVDPDKGKTTNQYTEYDELEKSTDDNDQALWYVYDKLGRKTEVREGSAAGPLRAKWKYDTLYTGSTTRAKGQLTEAYRYEPAGSANIYKWQVGAFDTRYQPTSANYVIPGVEDSGLAATWSYGYGYSPYDGSPTSITYPGGGGLATETVTTGYDQATGLPLNLKTNAINVGSYVTQQLYTAYGEPTVTKRQTTGGTLIENANYYDVHSRRLEHTVVSQFNASSVSDRHYQYTDAGTIIGIADQPQTGAADYQCFRQDALQRLTTAWTPASAVDCGTAVATQAGVGGPAPYWLDWTFDAAGNRTREVDHTRSGDITRTYEVPAGGAGVVRPHAVTAVTTKVDGQADVTTRYRYDDAGNLICRPAGATANTCDPDTNAQTLQWDAEGRLATAAVGATHLETNIYGADGERLIRRDANGTTLYLPGQEIHRAPSGAVTGTRYYAFATGTIGMRTAAGLSWIYNDHQGTQHTVIDSTTLRVTIRRQLPFGGPRTDPIWPNRKGFVGGDNEPTGLTRVGARHYDAALGRFISVDPVQDLTDPQQWNAYAYSNNSPISFSDPTGETLGSASCTGGMVGGPGACSGYENGYVPAYVNDESSLEDGSTVLPNGTNYNPNADGKGNASVNGVIYYLQTTNVVTVWEMAVGYDKMVGDMPDEAWLYFDPHDSANTERGLIAAFRQNYFTVRGYEEGKSDALWFAVTLELRTASGNTGSIHDLSTVAQIRAGQGALGGLKLPKMPGCTGRLSFSADTEVLLADGTTRQMKDLQIGDLVWATDPESAEEGPRRIEYVWVHDDALFALSVDGADVITTEDHPFWNESDGLWEEADDLDEGDLVRTPTGVARVDGFNASQRTTAAAYNLTIADIHTYYVIAGNQPVLVHNSCFTMTPLGRGSMQSPAGLIYNPGSKHGHRLRHLQAHASNKQPDPSKGVHTQFNVKGRELLQLVDEAWKKRGSPINLGGNDEYVIPMNKVVGAGGERSIQIMVEPGSSRFVTAYPVF